jgi:hypothetical protein
MRHHAARNVLRLDIMTATATAGDGGNAIVAGVDKANEFPTFAID